MNLGNALLQRQDPEAAGRQLQLAHDLFKEATVRDLLPELFGLLAEVALLRGDILEAEKMGQRSVELARELDMPCEEGHNLRILGEIAQADGRFEQAETHYVDSYAILKEVGDTYECAKTQLSLAELCSLQGSIENAEAALATCERTFSLLDAGLDLERVEEARRRLRQAKG
jgi:tetratricopeptide (TPR) repeat protein